VDRGPAVDSDTSASSSNNNTILVTMFTGCNASDSQSVTNENTAEYSVAIRKN
jgi:hypothetical protein